jgi:hypothetical protein
MRRFASASPTCIALPAFQSSAERIALGAERQSLHDAFKRETPPLIVDTARDSPVDWIAAELAVLRTALGRVRTMQRQQLVHVANEIRGIRSDYLPRLRSRPSSCLLSETRRVVSVSR